VLEGTRRLRVLGDRAHPFHLRRRQQR
jgi:hypothetical protein